MPEDDDERTRVWLVAQVRRLGYSQADAEHIVDLGVDPRRLEILLQAGCSEATAVRILA